MQTTMLPSHRSAQFPRRRRRPGACRPLYRRNNACIGATAAEDNDDDELAPGPGRERARHRAHYPAALPWLRRSARERGQAAIVNTGLSGRCASPACSSERCIARAGAGLLPHAGHGGRLRGRGHQGELRASRHGRHALGEPTAERRTLQRLLNALVHARQPMGRLGQRARRGCRGHRLPGQPARGATTGTALAVDGGMQGAGPGRDQPSETKLNSPKSIKDRMQIACSPFGYSAGQCLVYTHRHGVYIRSIFLAHGTPKLLSRLAPNRPRTRRAPSGGSQRDSAHVAWAVPPWVSPAPPPPRWPPLPRHPDRRLQLGQLSRQLELRHHSPTPPGSPTASRPTRVARRGGVRGRAARRLHHRGVRGLAVQALRVSATCWPQALAASRGSGRPRGSTPSTPR